MKNTPNQCHINKVFYILAYDQKTVNVVIFYCTFLQAQVLLQRRPTPLFIELRVEQLRFKQLPRVNSFD